VVVKTVNVIAREVTIISGGSVRERKKEVIGEGGMGGVCQSSHCIKRTMVRRKGGRLGQTMGKRSI